MSGKRKRGRSVRRDVRGKINVKIYTNKRWREKKLSTKNKNENR